MHFDINYSKDHMILVLTCINDVQLNMKPNLFNILADGIMMNDRVHPPLFGPDVMIYCLVFCCSMH